MAIEQHTTTPLALELGCARPIINRIVSAIAALLPAKSSTAALCSTTPSVLARISDKVADEYY